MRSQFSRLFVAAFLSGCGFLATHYWYKMTEKPVSTLGAIPLAQVGKVGDEVLRRSATRLLWRTVNTGDTLFNGESIRTSERGEVRIQFDDGRFIDLEPDSMIVLQKTKGEIALDLTEGSIFVNAKATGGPDEPGATRGPALVLNSNQGRVDLSGASASLAKGKGNQLDVQVLEGSANFQGRDGKRQEIFKGSGGAVGEKGITFDPSKLQIISPSLDKPVYINSEIDSKVTFQWRGFSPQWKVSLSSGSRRKDMTERSFTEVNPTTILSQFSLGKHYWKLIAKDPKTNQVVGESPVYKLDVVGRLAPSVIFPTADAKIQLNQPTYDMNFKWQKGDETRQITLEVATDISMTKKLAVKSFTTEDQFLLPNLKEGEYFWRLSAYFEGSDKPVFSRIQKFALQQPAKILPKEPAQIAWVTPLSFTVQYFVNDPSLKLDWIAKTRGEEIVQWHFKIQDVVGSPESAKQIDSKEGSQKVVLPGAGEYRMFVEALNRDGEIIGKSTERVISLKVTPLLKSPQLLPLNVDLKAKEDGRSEIKWEIIGGAKEYILIVKSSEGKELVRKRYSTTNTSLKNLMPGYYQLQVLSVDEHGRNSLEVPARTLLVPDMSSVRAPTNIRVKVKEE